MMVGDRRSSLSPPPRGGRSWYAFGALLASVVVAPQLLGGVFPWSVASTAAMAGIVGLVAYWSSTGRRAGAQATWVDLMPFAVLGWTSLQAIPLPLGVVQALSPEAWSAWTSNAAAAGMTAPAWIPLSVDPGATHLEITKGAIVTVAFVTARFLRQVGLGRQAVSACAASTVSIATVGLLHEIVRADQLFGFYKPVHAHPRVLSPLLNENHFAAFCGFGTCLCVGLILSARKPSTRAWWSVGAFATAIGCLWSLSRAGILSMLAGLVLFALVAWRRDSLRRHVDRTTGSLLVACGAGVALTTAVVAGARLVREFGFTHNLTSKLDTAIAAIPIAKDHPIMGIGRGAFSALFVRYDRADKRFYHAENLLAQWTVEWGIPVTIVLLGLLVWLVLRTLRQAKRPAYVSAAAAIASLGIHDMADFALEMTGVVFVAAVAFGASVETSRFSRLNVKTSKLCLWAAMLCLGSLALAIPMHRMDVMSLEAEVMENFKAGRYDPIQQLAEHGLRKHPAEPLLALVAAEAALRSQPESAGRWINRAQTLAPRWGVPHVSAARWLLLLGRQEQAMLEIQAAETKHPGIAIALVCRQLRDGLPLTRLQKAVPADSESFLRRVGACQGLASTTREKIDLLALELKPDNPGALTRHAARRLARGEPEDAIALLKVLPEPDAAATTVTARAYGAMGMPKRGLKLLAPWLGQPGPSRDVLNAAVALYAQAGEFQEMEQLGTRLRGLAKSKVDQLAAVDHGLGAQYEAHGRLADALRLYDSANRFKATPRTIRAIARVATKLGNVRRAGAAISLLCGRIDPSAPECGNRQGAPGSTPRQDPAP